MIKTSLALLTLITISGSLSMAASKGYVTAPHCTLSDKLGRTAFLSTSNTGKTTVGDEIVVHSSVTDKSLFREEITNISANQYAITYETNSMILMMRPAKSSTLTNPNTTFSGEIRMKKSNQFLPNVMQNLDCEFPYSNNN